MTAAASQRAAHADRRAGEPYAVVMLIFMMASQVINQFDRAVATLASAEIMRDLGLTLEQYGMLASAFYSLFAISGLLVGIFIAHRVSARALITCLIALWAFAQVPALIFPSFAALLLSRLILGAAESPGVAAAMALTHQWYAPERRNLPTSLVVLGSLSGTMLAPLVLIPIITNAGWRSGFLVCAILSAALFVALLIFGRNAPDGHSAPLEPDHAEAARGPRAKYRYWADRRIVMITVVAFLAYWSLSISYTWLFPMLHLGWGYGQIEAGKIVSLTFLVGVLPLLAISFLSQRMLTRGASFRRAVVLPTAASLFVAAACYCLTAIMPAGTLRLPFIVVGFGLLPSIVSSIPVMVSRVAPPEERSRLLLVVLTLESSAGMFAPYLTSVLVQRNGVFGYDLALYGCGIAASLSGLLAWTLFRDPDGEPNTASLLAGRAADPRKDAIAPQLATTKTGES